MREALAKVEGQRHVYTATFERFGRARGYQGREVVTLLLAAVKNASGDEVTDHIWFKMGKQFERLGLKPGDKVKFKARSGPYEKGYKGHRDWGTEDEGGTSMDFKLSFPTEIEIVSDGISDASQLPLLASVACPVCGGSKEKCKCK